LAILFKMTAENNIVPHRHSISRQDRRELLAQNSIIIWFTGLSGAGKSTIAGKVEELLNEGGFLTYLLDGDNLREGLNSNLGFSSADRSENIRRAGEVAKILMDAGVIVLAAFITPLREDRQRVRSLVGKEEFIEVYVNCPVEICEQRDTKGLYRKARAGDVDEFTGVSAIYEAPGLPEVEIRSDLVSASEAAEKIVRLVKPKLELA
jgi:adenylylsulfate kinase